jgi:hypothetical protein
MKSIPELEKIIAYVSSFRSGLMLEALEVNIYQQGGTEVFVPQRHGQVEVEPPKGSLTIEDVIGSTPDDHSRQLYKLLVDEWGKLSHVVQPGSVGASFQADVGGRLQPVFWAFPRYIKALMSTLIRRGVPPDVVNKYRLALASLPGFDQRHMMSDARPQTDLSRLSEAEIRSFVMESDKVVEAWRKAAEDGR